MIGTVNADVTPYTKMKLTERTLTERVSELERRMAQHDRDIEALKRATGIK